MWAVCLHYLLRLSTNTLKTNLINALWSIANPAVPQIKNSKYFSSVLVSKRGVYGKAVFPPIIEHLPQL